MAARTSREEVIAAATSGEGPTFSYSNPSETEKTDVESASGSIHELARTDTRVSFQQQIGVTKIESLCKL
jgi:hypothetical protein